MKIRKATDQEITVYYTHERSNMPPIHDAFRS